MRETLRRPIGYLALFLLLAACSPDDHETGSQESKSHVGADAHGATDAHAPAHAHEGAEPEGEPQSLLPIMRQLAIDMAGLQQALWLEDFEEVEARARAIAQHPHITQDELTRIRTTLGDETAGFDSLDVAVHEASVAMHEASRSGDPDAVLDGLAEVQRGCVACHTRFRDRLRTTITE